MNKKILTAMTAVVLLSAGVAFAGPHRGYAPEHGGWQGARNQSGVKSAPDSGWLDKAPQAVKDAFKQMDVKRSEMRLEIAKGNIDSAKLRAQHNDMLKASRVIADYHFDQALKNPDAVKNFTGSRGPGMGRHMGGGMHPMIQDELRKDNPDLAKVKQIYSDVMNLRDKQARERFELCLKYPGSFSNGYGYRGHF